MATVRHRPVIAASPAPPNHAGVARGTRIAIARGLIPVEAVVPGDAMLLEPGHQAPVAAVRPHGVQPTVCLRVQGGYELVAAPAHPVRSLDRHGHEVWRPLAALQPDDVVVLQPGRGCPPDLPYHPLPPCFSPHGNNHTTLRTPAVADEEFAYALGYLVGNGSLGHGRVSWSTNLRDRVVAETLAEKVRALRLSGRVRQLLNNTASLGRPVSPALAARVAALDPALVEVLGLHRLLRDGQLFLRVQSVTPVGPAETYGLYVPGARMWVSAGFISGQPAD